MAQIPNGAEKRTPLSHSLTENIRQMDRLLGLPTNADFVCRRLEIAGRDACVYFLQGMAGGERIDQFVIEPCQSADRCDSLSDLTHRTLRICECQTGEYYEELVSALVYGKSCLLLDGENEAAMLDTRGFEKRLVGKTQSESVLMGPQEGFVENLRTNITLIRRILHTEMLVSEDMEIGTRLKTRVSMMYLQGVAREETVDLVRRRILSIQAPQCPGSGFLKQMIEDHPGSLFPQMLQTERPDRTASMLSDGQVALLVDGSPFALIAPVTLFHLLHSADDAYLRWQNGCFLRIVRILGALLSLVLPALYLAITIHHNHMIPTDLLISIAESRTKVPFSVFTEILIMELSFFLINEAGTRIPTIIGPTIGIVGALILGQAAVAASIISPILIIIVAVTGLGGYAVPYYPLSLSLSTLRLALAIVASLFGLYGLTLCMGILTARLCALQSFGVPYLAPFSPHRPHNPDLLFRAPIWTQSRHFFLARKKAWIKEES